MARTVVNLVASAFFVFAVLVASAVGDKKADDRLPAQLPGGIPAFPSANYAGYFDVAGQRKFFYWFMESQSNPSTDPVVLWLNGGPGCSSMLGLFTEIGPYVLREGGAWESNAFSWNKQANVLYIESPGGVGFSQDTPGNPTNWTDELTATLNYEVLTKWIAAYPEYKRRRLVLTGESYAGHYVPQLAEKIAFGPNTDLREMLWGFMVGNPCTGSPTGNNDDWCYLLPLTEEITLVEYWKTHGLMSFDWPNVGFFNNSQQNFLVYDYLVRTCDSEYDWDDNVDMTQETALRRYNLRQMEQQDREQHHQLAAKGEGAGLPYGPCADRYMTQFLRKPEVVKALHAEAPPGGWSGCADILYPTWVENFGVKPVYERLMDNTTLKIMVYSGTADTVVNFIQTQKILLSWNRPVQKNFTSWFYQDTYQKEWQQLGGYYMEWDRLSWAGVRGAGHMVPTYQPAAAKQLLDSFLQTGKPGAQPPVGSPIPKWSVGPVPAAAAESSRSRDFGLVFAGIVAGVVVALVAIAAAAAVRRRQLGARRGGKGEVEENLAVDAR